MRIIGFDAEIIFANDIERFDARLILDEAAIDVLGENLAHIEGHEIDLVLPRFAKALGGAVDAAITLGGPVPLILQHQRNLDARKTV